MALEDYDIEQLSPAELKKLVDADQRVIDAKRQVAEQAAGYMKGIVPPHIDSGAYNASIGVDVKGTHVRVTASDYKAHWLEYGTEDTPEFAPRQKTQDHFNSLDITLEL